MSDKCDDGECLVGLKVSGSSQSAIGITANNHEVRFFMSEKINFDYCPRCGKPINKINKEVL